MTAPPAARPETDRMIFGFTWGALAVSLATVLVGVAMAVTDSMHLVGQDVGMLLVILLMGLFFLVSVPLHLGLLVAVAIRSIKHGPRPLAWVYVYFVSTFLVHLAMVMLAE